MSWFSRTPSTSAMSLMREAAAAVWTVSAMAMPTAASPVASAPMKRTPRTAKASVLS